ncbi:MAG: GntR family transcriptional regulator [Geminicoccaceae bacterium]|nr:GntR family transcriptional regulator [Geminicoccaceae bacterium]
MNEPGLKVERPPKSLRELTLEKMREAILDLRFPPGARLVERHLCEQLGVSRTVVREVLRHLEAEGLVQTVPRQGPIVARLDPARAAQVYEVRALLEGMAARAAAGRRDPEAVAELKRVVARIELAFARNDPKAVLAATTDFYETLFLSAEKRVAWEIVQSLNAQINHLRALTIASPNRADAAPFEMRRIVEAIERGDADGAAKAAGAHVAAAAGIADDLLYGGEPPARPSRPDPPAGRAS